MIAPRITPVILAAGLAGAGLMSSNPAEAQRGWAKPYYQQEYDTSRSGAPAMKASCFPIIIAPTSAIPSVSAQRTSAVANAAASWGGAWSRRVSDFPNDNQRLPNAR